MARAVIAESPVASGIRMAFLTACVAGIMSGGWLAALGVVAMAAFAVKTYGDLKRETQIEPMYDVPPARYESYVDEPGEYWQRTMEAQKGRGRER
jgi:hypothetical protein